MRCSVRFYVLTVWLFASAAMIRAQELNISRPSGAEPLWVKLPPFDINQLHFDPIADASEKPAPMESSSLTERADSLSTYRQPAFLQPGEDPENRLLKPFIEHMIEDQKNFWMSARDIAGPGARPFFAFAGFTGLVMAGDSWLSKQVIGTPSRMTLSTHLSDYATYSMIGAAGGAYLLGQATGNDHLQETGFLSGEAAINSAAISYLLKTVTQRQRPYQGNGNGNFFHGGTSFPSEHAAIAWSIASTVAHEYPGPLSQFLSYGVASAISLGRITGRQHFPSDVLVGGALGWYFARQVFRAHHDPEVGGTAWGDLVERRETPSAPKPEEMGSPFVPPDSWVYPLFDRLAALGLLQTNFQGQRPWTRMECARLLEEAGEGLRNSDVAGGEAGRIYSALAEEFQDELERFNGGPNQGIQLESVYERGTNISGTPLRDGFHFGQTIVDDYGRPYWTGWNSIVGGTAYAVAGPFFVSAQGEEQHAPASPSFPANVLQAFGTYDQAPGVPNGTPTINRFLLLDGAVGVTIKNLRISIGRQAEWLGPGEAGPLLYSDNSRPIMMLQIQSAAPFEIPLLSDILGPVRSEFFLGQLSGQQWVYNGTALQGPGFSPQPFIHGDKLSFRPSQNLEIGMGITAMFGGPGLPFTFVNFLKTYYSHKANIASNPAKRFSAFDITYRVPGMRDWLTLYLDSLVGDEISPIGSTRPVLNPGLYMPRIPKLHKLDLRVEGMKDPTDPNFAPGFNFFDRRYRSGYTNDGYLIGDWVGRQGIGWQAQSTYWFSPRTKLQLGYRHQQVDQSFLEGGHLSDFSARGDIMLGHSLAVTGLVQYENWNFPLLATTTQRNVTASLQLTLSPHLQLKRSSQP
jgi:membrane-associated phospholipid phosphatase